MNSTKLTLRICKKKHLWVELLLSNMCITEKSYILLCNINKAVLKCKYDKHSKCAVCQKVIHERFIKKIRTKYGRLVGTLKKSLTHPISSDCLANCFICSFFLQVHVSYFCLRKRKQRFSDHCIMKMFRLSLTASRNLDVLYKFQALIVLLFRDLTSFNICQLATKIPFNRFTVECKLLNKHCFSSCL